MGPGPGLVHLIYSFTRGIYMWVLDALRWVDCCIIVWGNAPNICKIHQWFPGGRALKPGDRLASGDNNGASVVFAFFSRRSCSTMHDSSGMASCMRGRGMCPSSVKNKSGLFPRFHRAADCRQCRQAQADTQTPACRRGSAALAVAIK